MKLCSNNGARPSSLSVKRKSARHPRNDCTAISGMFDDGGRPGSGMPPT